MGANPKTTLIGIMVIIGAIAKAIVDYLHTGTVDQADLTALLVALSGLGHIAAEDAHKNAAADAAQKPMQDAKHD